MTFVQTALSQNEWFGDPTKEFSLAQGFIYILVNPSIPDAVKIGKTQRNSEERAREISMATGVPTPFIVAFEEFFQDCDFAERYIHELLESRGVRTASNREFFSLRLQDAIRLIMEVKSELDKKIKPTQSAADIHEAIDTHPSKDILEQGYLYQYGIDDTLEDNNKAIALYKKAIRMGSLEGYILLAEALSDDSPTESVDWLKRGCEAGAYAAWLELGLIYSGTELAYRDTIPPHRENALKSFRMFFKQLDMFSYEEHCQYSGYYDSDASRIFFIFKKYIYLVAKNNSYEKDLEVIQNFGNHLEDFILCSGEGPDINIKCNELTNLLNTINCRSNA